MSLDDTELAGILASWMPGQRWFAGKDRRVREVEIAARTPLADDAEHLVVRARLDTGVRHIYQTPILITDAALPAGFIAESSAGYVHDGLHDQHTVDLLLAQRTGAPVDPDDGGPGLRTGFVGKGPPEGGFRVLSGEQSNTCVVVGEVLVKFYRRLRPGPNPDVELHSGLARVGSEDVDRLFGWMNGSWTTTDNTDERGHLAMLTAFIQDATTGSVLAQQAARTGDDFTAHAHRIGAVTARVHDQLLEAFGGIEVGAGSIRERAHRSVDRAAGSVPQIDPIAGRLHDLIDVATTDAQVAVQRIHGDLHLGQLLMDRRQWYMVDFEGEPNLEIAERRLPDSPLHDIAGMLRSFDYAHQLGTHSPDGSTEWTMACISAFSEGYAQDGDLDPRDHAGLLLVYLIDRAAHEAAYECRNRPELLHIPLSALQAYADG